ncbi:hypothetical protein [Streptomyces longisporus]|uniref:Uncharacterized protein n=1 Tax=Streptomyces longisporus TaxID=1948 RepID=A0ABN3M3Y3_STRLO
MPRGMTPDGFFFVVPLTLYPWASASGVVVGLAVCLFLAFSSAIREDTPPWWPIAPVGAGSAVAALVLVIKARRATEAMPVAA